MLNETDFKAWKEVVDIVIDRTDLDLTLRVEKLIPTPDNLQESSIPKAFWDSIFEIQSTSRFLEEIEQFFAKNEKVKTSNLLAKLISIKYKGRGNIREYIMELSNLVAKLKSFKLELDEDLIMHLVLISLVAHFGQFKYDYLYLIHEKFQSLDVFKSFKVEVEVELQLRKKTKVVKSDCGGEYYEQDYDEILRDHSQDILRLSQENYISKILDRFDMKDSKPRDTSIAKGDKFSLKQCPNNDLERNEMQKIFYASIHWKTVRRVIRYLRRTKGHMLTYRKFEDLEIIGYSNSNFAGCQDSKRSTSEYIYMLAGGAISWKFVKQTLIAPSTMVAKFVICFETSNQGIWL
ncbi:hypothetical protein CR513_06227, partial [Mucuna pruriens]